MHASSRNHLNGARGRWNVQFEVKKQPALPDWLSGAYSTVLPSGATIPFRKVWRVMYWQLLADRAATKY